MPRVFLVKNMRKRNILISNCVQGDVSIPVSLFPQCYVQDGCERNTAALPLSPCKPQDNSSGLTIRQEPGSPCYIRTHRPPYIRSKIKVTNGDMLHEDSASKLLNSVTPSCQICQKTFSNARTAKRHLKIHSNFKRYSCEFCGKGFNDTFDLKRHVRTHTGVRPFKCTMCNKAFTQRCSLETHLKKIHDVSQKLAFKERRDKLYVCEECGLTAHTQNILFTHLRTNHQSSKSQTNPKDTYCHKMA
ncbi:transcription factor Ovo-like 2 [Hoplias malabaricus]|uniref:transcription factor Ovo-like 2 n=1 Tax=Hoplias malabaricus TaxID=27720 RepID=UPI0034626C08